MQATCEWSESRRPEESRFCHWDRSKSLREVMQWPGQHSHSGKGFMAWLFSCVYVCVCVYLLTLSVTTSLAALPKSHAGSFSQALSLPFPPPPKISFTLSSRSKIRLRRLLKWFTRVMRHGRSECFDKVKNSVKLTDIFLHQLSLINIFLPLILLSNPFSFPFLLRPIFFACWPTKWSLIPDYKIIIASAPTRWSSCRCLQVGILWCTGNCQWFYSGCLKICN